MKKIYTTILLLGVLLMTSCSDWLDVAPSNQVNGDDMFADGNGYRNALNGVYINLAGTSMYGQDMTWGFMDVLAQTYMKNRLQTITTYRKVADYNLDDIDVKAMISKFWSVGYNDIANCNNLIYNVSTADASIFKEGEFEKNMIWGEALALRAFMHFDLLRMFAPSMIKDDKKAYIPYVDVYPTISTTYESNAEILQKIEKDLKQAKDLLAKCDTTETTKVWMTNRCRMVAGGTTDETPDDFFFAYRGFRMNYYAITAMLARVYRWAGRYEEAYKQAKEVIEATYDGSPCFDFVRSTEINANMKDYNSIIMAFSYQDLTEKYTPYITSGKQTLLIIDAATVFEEPNGGGAKKEDAKKEDVRGTTLLGDLSGSKYSLKYTIVKGVDGSDMIPMIRLSEMYYVMGEYYARNNDMKKAAQMLQIVRSARGIISKSLVLASFDEFKTELLKEVRKELLGEGQLFFEYKRFDQKPAITAKFVFERPENEDI